MISRLPISRLNKKFQSPYKLTKIDDKKYISQKKSDYNSELIMRGIYNKALLVQPYIKQYDSSSIDFEGLKSLKIPNFSIVSKNGVRGESLSSPKNRHFLYKIKKYGINSVIDLRDKYASKSYNQLCTINDLDYHHIPIDSSSVPDEIIIQKLPELFYVLNGENYYISCAQGLHRTDIALALNYIFNPNAKEPPVLKGHFRNNALKTEDINRRLNSIKLKSSEYDLKRYGWDDCFEKEFFKRKAELQSFNKHFFDTQSL